ncbi:hypothetical protein GF314_01115 [bacterium]|nr:hypothetical protein [bacterium]
MSSPTPARGSAMTGSHRIPPAELAASLGSGDRVVLDVLVPAQHEAMHVAGARNACVHEMVFVDRVGEIVPDLETPIVVVGAGGSSLDADLAAEKLTRAGYRDVAVLDGGRETWLAAGHPVEGEANAIPATPTPPVRITGEWTVDADASQVRWVGRNPGGFHDGSIAVTSGEVSARGGETTGRVTLDPRRLVNFDLEGDDAQPVLIAHLLSDDFLFADRFPTVVYEIASVEPWPEATITEVTHRIKGTLTMRGVTAPLEVDATISRLDDDTLVATASLGLDRTRWGMIYGSARFFSHLGMHVVFDEIDVSTRLVLRRD